MSNSNTTVQSVSDRNHISTLTLELGRAIAIVDLLYMVAAGKAVDSVDAMGKGSLENSLDVVLERLYAAQAAAEAIQEDLLSMTTARAALKAALNTELPVEFEKNES